MKYVYLTLNWIFGVLFGLTGLVSLIEYPLGSLFLIAISVLLLPPVRNAVYAKTKKELTVKVRAISIFVLFIAFGIFAGQSRDREGVELAAQKVQEQAEQADKVRQENIEYFKNNREKIISSVSTTLSEEDYQQVISRSNKYLAANDDELNGMHAQAKKALDDIKRAEKEAKEKAQPAQRSRSTINCDQGAPVSGQFFVKGRDINFRTGPDSSYSHVINQKATQVLGETQYRTLWPSIVLEGHCETDEWLQARIVEADGSRVSWETGWVHKQFVTGTASADMQAGLLWDIDGETDFTDDEKVLVKRGALKALKDEQNCKEIITGYRSGSRKGAYYVTCNAKNGGLPFNVWFTPGEVEVGSTLGVPEAYPEAPSRRACEKAVEARVSHPSTLNIHHIVGYATEVHNNGNRTVIQEFTAKNSFNLKIKHRAQCLIQPNGSLEITIAEAQ